ncbi:Tfp pilus assembly protein PilF, partial [Granulicella aggregans]|nr:Tfp pilus assembly protein PilF [Granulicella aggregans]
MHLFSSWSSTSAQKQIQNSRLSTFFNWCIAHQKLVLGLLSAAWVLVLYWNALAAPFVYDDLDQIVKNPELASFHDTFRLFFLAPSAFTSHFRGVGGSNYRPLFWLSLSIDRHIWGLHGAGGFHFTSIFLHWADGFLFFLFLRRVGVRFTIAASAVLIWLGLPINTEAVAWVSGRPYVLCGLFLLLALLSAHSYFVREKTSSLIAVLVASLAALLSHEAGVLFLPLVALLAYGMGRVAKRPAWILLAVVVGSDLIFLLSRLLVGTRAGSGGPSPWAIGRAFWMYCLWMLAPVHMSMQRATSMPPNVPSSSSIAALCAVVALCGAIFMIRKTAPILAAGLAWSTMAILPFCGIVFIYQGMAERYDYLASAGLALAISAFVCQYSGVLKGALVCLMALWIGWGAWRLKMRVLDWCDPVALYESSLEATPDAMLFYDLGWAWRERGDNAKALTEYQEAVRRQPDYEEAHASIGQIFSMLGQPAQAIPAYNRALALIPRDSDTRVDFAVTLEQLGDKEAAEREFRKALEFTPKNISALNDLGSLLILEGKLDEAIPYFEQAIQANPLDKNAYYSLGGISQQRGQVDKALTYYRKVLQIDPS